ncbi:MAG: hypothetical protein J6M95_02620 [Bacilli bacterium]|nr:hypothetical protein [Bacilli bacterium]
MIDNVDPRSKMLSSDEETVEVLEVVEDCYDYCDLTSDDVEEFLFDYTEEF